MLRRILFALFCLELGLFFLVLPWSEMWERNRLLLLFPQLRPFLLSSYLRGALSGLGLLNLWAGASDAWEYRLRQAPLESQRQSSENAAPLDAQAAVLPPSRSSA